jgi:hypothetical protein
MRVPGLRLNGMNHTFDVSSDGLLLATSHADHVSTEVWLLELAR